MIQLAKEFEAKAMPPLELLRIMLNGGHTDMKTVDGLCDYWRYISALSANFKADYQHFFGDK